MMRHITFLRLISLFVVPFILGNTPLLAQTALGASEALPLLMNAYQNGGFNPLLLNSGVAEFEIEKRTERSSETRAMLRKKTEEAIKEKYANDPKKAALVLESVSGLHGEAEQKVARSRVRILFLGNDRIHGEQPGEYYKRLYDCSEYVPGSNKWVGSVSLSYGSLRIRPDDTAQASLMIGWAPGNQHLSFFSLSYTRGEFQFFGRFQEDGIAAELIRQKVDRKTFTFSPDVDEYVTSELLSRGLNLSVTGEVDYDSGAKARVIELKKGDTLLEKYHIDVERGYLCPYQFVADGPEEPVFERVASDFIQEKNTGLFYPQKYQERTEIKEFGTFFNEYTLIPDTLRFNQRVSEKEFAIDIPEGAYVGDFRDADKPIDYIATKKGTISLAKGGYDLNKFSWLVRTYRTDDDAVSSGGARGMRRLVWMCSGVVLVLVVLYIQWKKRFA